MWDACGTDHPTVGAHLALLKVILVAGSIEFPRIRGGEATGPARGVLGSAKNSAKIFDSAPEALDRLQAHATGYLNVLRRKLVHFNTLIAEEPEGALTVFHCPHCPTVVTWQASERIYWDRKKFRQGPLFAPESLEKLQGQNLWIFNFLSRRLVHFITLIAEEPEGALAVFHCPQ